MTLILLTLNYNIIGQHKYTVVLAIGTTITLKTTYKNNFKLSFTSVIFYVQYLK